MGETNKEFGNKKSNLDDLVFDYMKNAKNIYLIKSKTGKEDNFDELSIDLIRKSIKNVLRYSGPFDLSNLYKQLMNENMSRIKKVDNFDENTSMKDVCAWRAEAQAFLDIIDMIRDKRYDYQSANFIEFNDLVVQNPIRVIEEVSDIATHNDRIKKTQSKHQELMSILLFMNNGIEEVIADMTSEQLDEFRDGMKSKKVAYENALTQHFEDTEYLNSFDKCVVPLTINGELNQLIRLQKEYNIDMVKKYSDRKYGLIPYVDNIDRNIEKAIMGE